VCAALCSWPSVRQCAAMRRSCVCGSARSSVRQCGAAVCVAVQVVCGSAAVCGSVRG
jgi:hypothetical protein